MKQAGSFGWGFVFVSLPYFSASANVGVSSPLEVFQLAFSNEEHLLFLPLSCFISGRKKCRAYLVLSKELLLKKQNHLLLFLEHRVRRITPALCIIRDL